MSDRFVRKVSPAPGPAEQPKPFSEYLEFPNLVLLGDPGAGKSHLFRHFATVEGGSPLLTRDFLNLDVPSLCESKILFIDALDEKRAGRSDENTIDEIVRKLFVVKPQRVRIACRAADWLGDTDLAAFQTYFDHAGGVVVLGLEPLSEHEAEAVLKERRFAYPKPFLEEARRKGLEELLANPQNLIMLADVVQRGNWPAGRTELFQKSMHLLLSEHNTTHAHRKSGSYSSDELLEAASSLCAVRLISDIDGISLSETRLSDDFPSYRDISLCDPDHARAALERRVFVSGPKAETLDYAHRTIAEYLAASWLAKKVRAGLPIGRVRALIGVDGRPASELRGLHAWLAIFLPEHAMTLIHADPFGVLSYGDAASLTSNQRKHLLEALAKLAEVDPWFRAGNWSSSAIGALSDPDMAESFRPILRSKDANFHLRSLVLDALSAGTPISELQPDVLAILVDAGASFLERQASLEALLAMGNDGAEAVAAGYDSLRAAKDLGLRAEILKKLYGTHLGIAQAAALLDEALEAKDELALGAFWGLDEIIPDCDIGALLDRIEGSRQQPDTKEDYLATTEVLRVFDRLLVRILSAQPEISGERLWKWLNFRRRCGGHYSHMSAQDLKQALCANNGVLVRLTDAALSSFAVDDNRGGFVYRLNELALNSIEDEFLLERIVQAIDHSENRKKALLYDVALTLTFGIGVKATATFERLYDYAEGEEALEVVRAFAVSARFPSGRLRKAKSVLLVLPSEKPGKLKIEQTSKLEENQ